MLHKDLPDGRWFELRRIWLSDRQKIVAVETLENQPVIERLAAYADILDPAVTSKSWEGTMADMPEAWILETFADWYRYTTDEVAPKASGTPSTTTSPPGESPCRTARKRRSPSGTSRSG